MCGPCCSPLVKCVVRASEVSPGGLRWPAGAPPVGCRSAETRTCALAPPSQGLSVLHGLLRVWNWPEEEPSQELRGELRPRWGPACKMTEVTSAFFCWPELNASWPRLDGRGISAPFPKGHMAEILQSPCPAQTPAQSPLSPQLHSLVSCPVHSQCPALDKGKR